MRCRHRVRTTFSPMINEYSMEDAGRASCDLAIEISLEHFKFNSSLDCISNSCIFRRHGAEPARTSHTSNSAINRKQSLAKLFVVPLLALDLTIHLKIYKIIRQVLELGQSRSAIHPLT
uniref:Uncharacterized protein n=1 Tax=Arundo donax TaxID=35708 RepID=A0A0A8Y036_ARUDO